MLFDYQNDIVTTGKYLNVMRESGCPIQPLSFDGIFMQQTETQPTKSSLQGSLDWSPSSLFRNSNIANANNKENVSINDPNGHLRAIQTQSILTNNNNNKKSVSNISNASKSGNFEHSLHKCHPRELGQYIREAYHFASKALLEMLMIRERIMERFRCIHRYMLLSEGDWFEYFVDMSESILNKNAVDIKIVKLNRLLELSIRTSVSKNDSFKDNISCDIKNKDLHATLAKLHELKIEMNVSSATCGKFGSNSNNINSKNSSNSGTNNSLSGGLLQLTGMQAFALDYKVEWPASIIFTGRNVVRYQLIFRLLFKLKIVERQLKFAWKEQMCLREFNLYNMHNKSLLLRQKMLKFIESLLFYIFYEVVEPNWCQFMKKMKNKSQTNTVDQLLELQDDFLQTTMHMCLLTDNAQIEVLCVCVCV